jgi:hypothetical protein
MKPRLFLTKRIDGTFIPSTDDSAELSKKIAYGESVEVKGVNRRLVWYHRRFFLAVKFIHLNMPENFMELYPTQESLRKGLLMLAGHTEKIYNPDGSFTLNVKSMNFETVKQDEFEGLYNAMINAGFKYFITDEKAQRELIDLT